MKNREQRGNEEAGPYRRLTAHPRLTSLLFPTIPPRLSRLSLTTLVPYAGGSNEAVWRREVNRENDSSEAEHTELSHLHVVHLTLPSHRRPA